MSKSNFLTCTVTSSVMKTAFKFQIICSFSLNLGNKECVLGLYGNTFFQWGKRTLLFISCAVAYNDECLCFVWRRHGTLLIFLKIRIFLIFWLWFFFSLYCAMPFLVMHLILLPSLLDLCISFSHYAVFSTSHFHKQLCFATSSRQLLLSLTASFCLFQICFHS